MSKQYALTAEGFSIVSGAGEYNRPLFGSNHLSMILAGDRPRFLVNTRVSGGNPHPLCGPVLELVLCADGRELALKDATDIEFTYVPGMARYAISEGSWPGLSVALEVVPLAADDGMVARVSISGASAGAELVSVIGDEGEFCRFDTAQWQDGRLRMDGPKSHERNRYGMLPANVVFCNGDPTYKHVVAAWTWPGEAATLCRDVTSDLSDGTGPRAEIGIRYAAALGASPEGSGTELEGYVLLGLEADNELRGALRDPAGAYTAGVARIQRVSDQVVVETPSPKFDMAVRAMNHAMDGYWSDDFGVWMHGTWSWYSPFLGWRGWYGPNAAGWHDRSRRAVLSHLAGQLTAPPRGTDMDTLGGIPSVCMGALGVYYNMCEVFLDQTFHHWQWTGDRGLMASIYDKLALVMDWEQRCFERESSGLYENRLNTYISDGHWYSGGRCAQSTAYAYRANRMMAELARQLGKDPARWDPQAEKILTAFQAQLWVRSEGHPAEYIDYWGRLHPEPELASIYHSIESGVLTPAQAYEALAYVTANFEHTTGWPADAAMVWSSRWKPGDYCNHILGVGENMHLAWCYQGLGMADEAWRLTKGTMLRMYRGEGPALLGHGWPDPANGYSTDLSDFSDSVGCWVRSVLEGMFGVRPDLHLGRIIVSPAFPSDWDHARIRTPDFTVAWNREGCQERLSFHTEADAQVVFRLPARSGAVEAVTLDGRPAEFRLEPGIGFPYVVVEACGGDTLEVGVRHSATATGLSYPTRTAPGEQLIVEARNAECLGVEDPQGVLDGVWSVEGGRLDLGKVRDVSGHHVVFAQVRRGDAQWLAPIAVEVTPAPDDAAPAFVAPPPGARFTEAPLDGLFNGEATNIFKRKYTSPRAPYSSPRYTEDDGYTHVSGAPPPELDDSARRGGIGADGLLHTAAGVPFRTPREGKNTVFFSHYDAWPTSIEIPVGASGKALYLLLFGTTSDMQSFVNNGLIEVIFSDDRVLKHPLRNPTTYDHMLRPHFADANMAETLGNFHADVISVALEPGEVSSVRLTCLSNEVIMGLLGVSVADW